MKNLRPFDEFLNEAKNESYPVELQNVIDDLINKLGMKKYQISVGNAYGVYMIDLPATALSKSMMRGLLEIMPDESSVGAFSSHGNGLVLRTNIRVQSK